MVGVVGAGAYATRYLLPALGAAGAGVRAIASAGGVSAAHAAAKFDIPLATTDVETILSDASIDTVVIATRHDTHAALVERALSAGKHVWVEKPLALEREEIARIEKAYESARRRNPATVLMVGFNRRFAPHVGKLRQLLEPLKEPKVFLMTVNAGAVPQDHWTRDPAVGGGRILGEACHFIDLLRYLAGAPSTALEATRLDADAAILNLSFADGSRGAIHYLTNGHRSIAKERLEVFCGGRAAQLENFRRLRGHGWPGFHSMNLWRQNKGQREAVAAFVEAIRNGRPSPIPFAQIVEVAGLTVEAAAR